MNEIDSLMAASAFAGFFIFLIPLILTVLLIVALISIIQINNKFGKLLELYESTLEVIENDDEKYLKDLRKSRAISSGTKYNQHINQSTPESTSLPISSEVISEPIHSTHIDNENEYPNESNLPVRSGLVVVLGAIALIWIAILIAFNTVN